MRRSLFLATTAVAALTVAANRPIPERVRDAVLQAMLTNAYCEEVKDAPKLTNAVFPSGSGPLRSCAFEAGDALDFLRFAISAVANDKDASGPLSWNQVGGSLEGFAAAETKLIGKSFLVPSTPEGGNDGFRWDPAAFEAAFNAYYVKPVATVGGLRAQQVYDIALKARVTRFVDTLAVLTHTPALLGPAATAIRERAVPDPKGFYWSIFNDLNTAGKVKVDSGDVGFFIRREADGTLPAFRKLLVTFLKDYDPAAAKRLDDKSLAVADGRQFVRVRGSSDDISYFDIGGRSVDCDAGGCPPVRLAPGKVRLRAYGKNDSDADLTVEVTAKTTELVVPLLRSSWRLDLSTEPAGLQLAIDGQLVPRRTPLSQQLVKLGEHTLKVVDPCHEPVEAKLLLTQSKPDVPVLKTRPRTAVLRVETVDFDGKPAEATATLDGQPLATLNADANVPRCSRQLVVKGANGKEFKSMLALDPAQPTVKRFVVNEPPRPSSSERAFSATWTTLGRQALAGQDRAAVSCPRRSGKVNPVWGDGTFTDDSSVCAAAQFRGRIDANGGRFYVRRVPGRDAYPAASVNGVETKPFGRWNTSFEVE